MNRIVRILCGVFLCGATVGCHGVCPEADEESVLIMKPWLIGHGGVDMTPVTTGLT